MPTLQLTPEEAAMIGGEAGPAAQLAARLVVRMAGIMGADRLVPIAAAHVDGCLYHGPVSTDFARTLVDGGGKVRVPTTLPSRSMRRVVGIERAVGTGAR